MRTSLKRNDKTPLFDTFKAQVVKLNLSGVREFGN